jgi:hypothetical protein
MNKIDVKAIGFLNSKTFSFNLKTRIPSNKFVYPPKQIVLKNNFKTQGSEVKISDVQMDLYEHGARISCDFILKDIKPLELKGELKEIELNLSDLNKELVLSNLKNNKAYE